MEQKTLDLIKPHIALLAIQIAFGTMPVVGKFVMKEIPAFAFVGFRVGVTAVILLIIQALKDSLVLQDNKDYFRFFWLSIFGISLNQLLFIGGLSHTTATNTSLLVVTIPIFTLIFSAFLGIEKMRWFKVFGIILAAFGVLLLIDPSKASFSSETTLGDLMIILNCMCYGIYIVLSKDIFARNGALKSTAWVFAFASLICIPLGIYTLSTIDFFSVSKNTWLATSYIVIFSTTIPYLLISWTLARVRPSTFAVYVYLQPLIGFCLAVFFLNEHFTIFTILAAILIFIGVYFATKKVQNVTENKMPTKYTN